MSRRKTIPATAEMWREACNMQEANDPGYTLTELCELLGCGRLAMEQRIKRLIKEGKCTKGRGTRLTANGRKYFAAVYELK